MPDYQKKRDDTILKYSLTPEQEADIERNAVDAERVSAAYGASPSDAAASGAMAREWPEFVAESKLADYDSKMGNRPSPESASDSGARPMREVSVDMSTPSKAGYRATAPENSTATIEDIGGLILQLPPDKRAKAIEMIRALGSEADLSRRSEKVGAYHDYIDRNKGN